MGAVGVERRKWVAALVVAVLGCLALLPAGAGAEVIYPPRASGAVRTAEGFELKGTVYDYGGTTTYHFEYGLTDSYGTSVPVPDADASSGIATAVSQQITGLMPDTTYHWKLVSTNSGEGSASTADQSFSTSMTAGTPPPTGTAPGTGMGTGAGMAPGEANPYNPYPGQGGSGSNGPTVGGSGPKMVAKTLHLKGRTLLTATNGHTLYALSAEAHGKFICTAASSCTSIWHPLTVAAGVVPKGPVKLGTVRRPEGTMQVTYRGRPLYTFGGDKKRGQTKGEGFKDVGTWHAVTVPTK